MAFSSPRTCIVDGFAFRLLTLSLAARLRGQGLRILCLPPMLPSFLWGAHRLPALRRVDGARWVARLAIRINPRNTIEDVPLEHRGVRDARAPFRFVNTCWPDAAALDGAGRIAVVVAERIGNAETRRLLTIRRNLRRLFLDDDDYWLAFKRVFSWRAETVTYGILAATHLRGEDAARFLIANSENARIIREALASGTLHKAASDRFHLACGGIRSVLYLVTGAISVTAVLLSMIAIGLVRHRRADEITQIKAKIARINLNGTAWDGDPTHAPRDLRDDASPIDGRRFHRGDLIIIGTNRDPDGNLSFADQYERAGLRLVDAATCRLGATAYARLFLAAIPRALAAIATSATSPILLAWVAALPRLFRGLLPWVAVARQVRFGTFIDHEEERLDHALRAIAFAHYGGRLVFPPLNFIGHDNSQKNFQAYHLYFVPGEHFVAAYGRTWAQNARIAQVGIIANDLVREPIPESWRRHVDSMAAQGLKTVAVFPSSGGENPYCRKRYQALADAATALLERRNDVVIAVKMKASTRVGGTEQALRAALSEAAAAGRVVYCGPGTDFPVSVQQLAHTADAVVSMCALGQGVGSAWVESMCLGKPSFALDPPETGLRTPFFERFHGTTIFPDIPELLDALDSALDNPGWINPKDDLASRYFDPFRDANAYDRFVDALRSVIDDSEAFERDHPTVSQAYHLFFSTESE